MRLKRLVPVSLLLFLALAAPCIQPRSWAADASGPSLAEFEKTATEFTLANGMKFIVVERHQVPTVAFHLYMDVGSVDEVTGKTGISHLFEHLAFKGTKTIGTKDYAGEDKALKALDQAYLALDAERQKGPRAEIGRAHV